ncbi:MAG: hypothetical protein HC838_17270 [Spirulinaceae cyanobacterium RM2_2_10]|nr:hypothetical protein [Spirulinaceae cyanobacterium SM2_1_0]NJO21435.1 hypothetical protein [Spirulinaceae cyanobacterium RM2_2_10]
MLTTSTIKQLCGLAGVVSVGFALSAPAALAETLPETSNSEQATTLIAQTEMAFSGEDECPGPDGGYAPGNYEVDFEREPDQDYNLECWGLSRRGFICVNNPNPECENPLHYGQIWGTQYTSPVEGLVEQFWAEIGANPPTPTLPPPAAVPPPVAPVPGLW